MDTSSFVLKFSNFLSEVDQDEISVSQPQCSVCSLEYGAYVRPDFKSADVLTKITNISTVSVCPANYQCVGNDDSDTLGCCQKCTARQLCMKGTISLGEFDANDWNICPPGFLCFNDNETVTSILTKCEPGTMCYNNKKLRCTEARQVPIDAGYGDIHAGSYCPAGSFGFSFCPIGRYCNSTDMSVSYPCPAGKFCPLKTETPFIDCAGCDEGAIIRPINPKVIGFIIGISILWVLSLLGIKLSSLIKKRKEKKELRKRRRGKLIRKLSTFEDEFRFKQAAREKARPPSDEIVAASTCISVRKLINAIRNEDLTNTNKTQEPSIIFDKLDVNANGELSYDDLNKVLNLSEVKLRYFVRKMNKFGEIPIHSTTVSKRCFVDHFLDVLDKTEHFQPDVEEATAIFEAIDLDGDGLLKGNELHPQMEDMLTDRQIRVMIKKMSAHNQPIDKQTFVNMYHLILTELDDASVTPDRSIDISFRNLELTVEVSGKKLNVLDSVSGRIQEGTLTAIMGGSGAGKTSLLNVLSGRAYYGSVSGKIAINGIERRLEYYEYLLGFVPQDDILYPELTIRENFIYAGRFQLPPQTTFDEIEDIADDLIATLGLTRVADSLVGDVENRILSGGERKRVNIGIELMGKPRILFLDEPTSGLDASSSSLVMASLKSLVENDGVTCVSVIHQPRKFIYELFDNIILMGPGGKIVYHGQQQYAQTYFENLGYQLPPGENISDWLLDISTGQLNIPRQDRYSKLRKFESARDLSDRRSYLCQQWDEYLSATPDERRSFSLDTPEPFEIASDPGDLSFLSQLYFQVKRNMLIMYRNRNSKFIDCAVIVMAVVLISVISGKNKYVNERFYQKARRKDFENRVVFDMDYINNLNRTETLFQLFAMATLTHRENAIKVCILTSVLIALVAARNINEKRLQFLREMSSGYDINAYFVASNITSTLELSIQMILSGFFCAVIIMPISSWFSFILNFAMLGWVSVSWSFLLSTIVPPKNIVVVLGGFLTFTNIFLTGALPPWYHMDIYENDLRMLVTGFLGPGRYFVETFVISDFKCLPIQTGFTVDESTTSIPTKFLSFEEIQVGHRDENVSEFSCQGWYGGYLPAFFVGLSYRLLALGLLHVVSRRKQSKTSFLRSLTKLSVLLRVIIFVIFILALFALSWFFILD